MDGQQGPGCHTWSPPSSSPCRGGASQGAGARRGNGLQRPSPTTAGGPTVELPSQAPQPYLRFESWKDVDSGSEGVCLSRAGQVLFHHLVHSTNLLSTDWVQTNGGQNPEHPKTL